jgi:hypothetical protein
MITGEVIEAKQFIALPKLPGCVQRALVGEHAGVQISQPELRLPDGDHAESCALSGNRL